MHLTINIHDVILGKKEPSLNYKNAILRISLTYNLPAKIELEIYWKLQTLHTGLLSDSYDNRNPWVPDDTINFLYIKKVKKRIDRVEAGLSWNFDAFNTKLYKTRKSVLLLSKLSLKSNKAHITWLAKRKAIHILMRFVRDMWNGQFFELVVLSVIATCAFRKVL